MEENNIFYLVGKIMKSIRVSTAGNTQEVTMGDCFGVMPVYDNIEDANRVSENGTYPITVIETK